MITDPTPVLEGCDLEHCTDRAGGEHAPTCEVWTLTQDEADAIGVDGRDGRGDIDLGNLTADERSRLDAIRADDATARCSECDELLGGESTSPDGGLTWMHYGCE